MELRVLLNLLGKPLMGKEMQQFLSCQSGRADEDEFGNYLCLKEAGISFYSEKKYGAITSIFLYGRQHEGYLPYSGDLPGNVSFQNSREEIRSKFPPPIRAAITKGPDIAVRWDLFEQDPYTFHFEYSHDTGNLQLVTLALVEDSEVDS